LESNLCGRKHVIDRHFHGRRNASQFTIPQSELRALLQSKEVVSSRIIGIENSDKGLRYIRSVDTRRIIGTDKLNNFNNTSNLMIWTDKYGNLITTYPGRR